MARQKIKSKHLREQVEFFVGVAVPWTGRLEVLSEFDVEDIVMQQLKNSMAKVLDSQAGIQFTSAQLKAVNVSTASVALTTNGTATSTATSDLTAANWRDIADDMQARNIPFFDGSNYIVIGSIKLISGLFNDSATAGFVDVHKYTGEFAGSIVRGEAGSYYMGRFVKETNFLDNSIGDSTAYGSGVAFGADAVITSVTQIRKACGKNVSATKRRELQERLSKLTCSEAWEETRKNVQRLEAETIMVGNASTSALAPALG